MPIKIELDQLGSFSVNFKKNQKKSFITIKKQNELHIEIEIENLENCSSFKVNKKELLPSKYIPKELYSILNECYKQVVQRGCRYSYWNENDRTGITIPRRSLPKIPEFHLRKLVEANDQCLVKKKFDQKFSLKFLSDILEDEDGVDTGALRKQYVEEIFRNLLHSNEIKFLKPKQSGLAIPTSSKPIEHVEPALTPQEDELYYKFGYIMGHLHETDFLNTGIYFDQSLFSAILAFADKEVDKPFNDLSKDVKLRIAQAMVQARVDSGYKDPLYKCFECAKLVKEKIDKNPFDENDENELKNALLNGGINLFAAMPNKFVNHEDEELKFDEIKANRKEFLQGLYSTIFNHPDSDYGTILNQLAIIHRIAQGIKSAFDKQNKIWQGIRENGAMKFVENIQGTRNRQEIVDRIDVSIYETPFLKTKTEWLKQWILNEASDEQVSLFLRYCTGASTLTEEKKAISIQRLERLDKDKNPLPPTPLPLVHACGYRIEMCNEASSFKNSDGEYTDETKEGFIKVLTELVFRNENMGFYLQ